MDGRTPTTTNQALSPPSGKSSSALEAPAWTSSTTSTFSRLFLIVNSLDDGSLPPMCKSVDAAGGTQVAVIVARLEDVG